MCCCDCKNGADNVSRSWRHRASAELIRDSGSLSWAGIARAPHSCYESTNSLRACPRSLQPRPRPPPPALTRACAVMLGAAPAHRPTGPPTIDASGAQWGPGRACAIRSGATEPRTARQAREHGAPCPRTLPRRRRAGTPRPQPGWRRFPLRARGRGHSRHGASRVVGAATPRGGRRLRRLPSRPGLTDGQPAGLARLFRREQSLPPRVADYNERCSGGARLPEHCGWEAAHEHGSKTGLQPGESGPRGTPGRDDGRTIFGRQMAGHVLGAGVCSLPARQLCGPLSESIFATIKDLRRAPKADRT